MNAFFVLHLNLFYWGVLKIDFLLVGHKVNVIALYGVNNSILCNSRKEVYFARVKLKNKCFSRVAHDFFATGVSKNRFVCLAGGNKMPFMTLWQKNPFFNFSVEAT